MATQITLDYFEARDRHYHIYQIGSSDVAEQLHCHDYYQVCFVDKGQIDHAQSAQNVRLGQGDVFIVPPGFSHRIGFVGKNTRLYSLCFDEGIFSPGFPQSHAYQFLLKLQDGREEQHPIRLRLVPEESQLYSLRSLMECLLREQEARWPRQLTAAASLISAIVCILAQCYYQQPQNKGAYREMTQSQQIMENCIRYVDGHYNEPLSQTQLLKRFAISRSAFCAAFAQQTGLSLKQYISRKRVQKAQTLLREDSSLSLQQVADRVGYGEISTFYRNFVQVAGVSPSKYRSLYRPVAEK